MIKKTFFLNFILTLISLTLALFLCEGIYRIYLAVSQLKEGELSQLSSNSNKHIGNTNKLAEIIKSSENSNVVYELKPSITATFLGKPLRTNQFNGRGENFEPIKNPNKKRIIGIGDSIMFGWGVNEEDTYLKQLESQINSSNYPIGQVEILNFGVPGYNTAMEVALLKHKLLQLKPDLVILHIVGNDLSLPRFLENKKNLYSLKQCYLCDLIKTRLLSSKAEKSNLLDLQGNFSERSDHNEIQSQYKWMVGYRAFEKSLNELKILSIENNFKVIFLISSTSKIMLKSAKSVAKNSDIKIINIKKYVKKYFSENYPNATKEERFNLITIGQGDPHPNKIGHSIYTEALLKYFKK